MAKKPQPEMLEEKDIEAPCSEALERMISPTAACEAHEPGCRLLDCGTPAPTFESPVEAPKLEFSDFRKRVELLTSEFFLSGDVAGMVTSLAALQCPSYHDELAAFLLRAALDKKEREHQWVVELLGRLLADKSLTTAQLVRGFEKLVLSWDDLQLDVPSAPGQLVALLSSKVGLLDRSLFARLPEGLLRRLAESLEPQQGAAREALRVHLEELGAFKGQLAEHVERDLFCNRSIEAFLEWLRAAESPAFHHEVVLAACQGSFELQPSPEAFWMSCFDPAGLAVEKRTLVLRMLSQFHSSGERLVLDEVDLQLGFSRLLGMAGQMSQADLPLVVALVVGAIEQELLPAEFLKSARRLRFGGASGVQVVRKAQRQTPMHSRRAWGSGDARQFREEIREAIIEYFDSKSVEELAQIVEELHLSEKEQAQFVRKLLVTGMERGEPDAALDATSELLGSCWSSEEVRAAFEQLRDISDDLVLDLPRCREQTSRLVSAAAGRGLLARADVVYDGITIV